jgi:hypothetical protein
MDGKKDFDVRIDGETYRVPLDEGMDLVQRMDATPYDLSDHELQCAQRFESFFLEIKR